MFLIKNSDLDVFESGLEDLNMLEDTSYSNFLIAQHLKQQLAPLYLITGSEILLVEEARDLIRHQAQAQVRPLRGNLSITLASEF